MSDVKRRTRDRCFRLLAEERILIVFGQELHGGGIMNPAVAMAFANKIASVKEDLEKEKVKYAKIIAKDKSTEKNP